MRSLSITTGAAAFTCLSLASSTSIVTISNGTVSGSVSGVVETFSGIPYAQPPIGSLRFRPSIVLNNTFGSINATGTPPACPQLSSSGDPNILSQVPSQDLAPYSSFFTPPITVSEDCLTLNVQRPSSATSVSKLPVIFWIYGGGFDSGSTQANDWANFVAESVSLGHPVLVVQANYRVSAFGFLGGAELKAEGSTNVGMRDQRLALKWVADNIAAFGGDPNRVTLWGQSAGAQSVLNHLVINGGDNMYNGKPLFHSAIMNSGSSLPAEPVDGISAQAIFDNIATAGGCGTALDRLACLRDLPYDDFFNATNVAPSLYSYHGIQLSFPGRLDPNDSFFAVSPEQAIRTKRIVRIPIISGSQNDEGSLFGIALYNGTTTDTLVDRHLRYLYPTAPRSILRQLVDTYSTDPALGSPFGTGSANQLYHNYKRNSAIIGDGLFTFQRRAQLEQTADLVPTWSYVANYNQSSPLFGTAHGADIAMFSTGVPEVPYKHILHYYISFVNYLDPNRIVTANNLTKWPRYTLEDKTMIQFNVDGESLLHDNYREGSYEYFKTVQSEITV